MCNETGVNESAHIAHAETSQGGSFGMCKKNMGRSLGLD